MLIRRFEQCKSLAEDRQHGLPKVLGKLGIGKESKKQSDVTGLIESLERGSKMKISTGLSGKCNSVSFWYICR